MEGFVEEIIAFLSNVKINTVLETIAAILTIFLTLFGAISGLRKYLSKRKTEKVQQTKPRGHLGELSNRNELNFDKFLEEIEPKPSNQKSAKIFISYKVSAHPDEELLALLQKTLTKRGHKPFIHTMLPLGVEWGKSLQKQIEISDYLLVLLSEASIKSEMILGEITHAEFHRASHQKPIVLPVRIRFLGKLPYGLANLLEAKQFALWNSETDNETLISKIISTIESEGEESFSETTKLLDDKEDETDDSAKPLPSFDPRLLETPTGAVKLKSPYYIRRDCDDKMEMQISKGGSTTTIRAGRQMGKTSLLVRGAKFAKTQGQRVVYADFQQIKPEFRSSLDHLLHYLADEITFRLNLDIDQLNKIWSSSRGGPDKFNQYMEEVALADPKPLLIAIDEADCLLDVDYKTDFFALLRAWDSRRAFDEAWEYFSLALVISTHPHLLIDDYRQSPFNVGMRIQLEDFTLEQISHLNTLHDSPLPDRVLPEMMKLLGGHPYLIRQAFYSIVEQNLKWGDFESLAMEDPGPFSSHFHFYLWQLRDRPELVAGIKEVIKKQTCSDEMVLYRLVAAGLMKELPDKKCAIRCGLYENYFRKTLNA